MAYSGKIKDLLGHLIGTKNTLSNNILFIDFTGSHEKAQLLSQIWYWSSRTKIKGGWVCKTHAEWFDEIRVKSHSVRRFTKEFCEMGFLESKLKKFDGVPKPHYRLDTDELIRQLVTFCEGNKLSPSQNVTLEPDKLLSSIEGDTKLPSTNINLFHRLNTESKENAPAKTEKETQPKGSENTPPPDSAPPPSPELPPEERAIQTAIENARAYMEQWPAMRPRILEGARLREQDVDFDKELENWVRHHGNQFHYLSNITKNISSDFARWMVKAKQFNYERQGKGVSAGTQERKRVKPGVAERVVEQGKRRGITVLT